MLPTEAVAIKFKGHLASTFQRGGKMGESENGMGLEAHCGLYCGSFEIFRACKDRDAALLLEEAEESGRPIEETQCDRRESGDVIF